MTLAAARYAASVAGRSLRQARGRLLLSSESSLAWEAPGDDRASHRPMAYAGYSVPPPPRRCLFRRSEAGQCRNWKRVEDVHCRHHTPKPAPPPRSDEQRIAEMQRCAQLVVASRWLGSWCYYCGTLERPFELDHVIARRWGGGDEPTNLVTACRACNRAKGTYSPLEFRLLCGEWAAHREPWRSWLQLARAVQRRASIEPFPESVRLQFRREVSEHLASLR